MQATSRTLFCLVLLTQCAGPQKVPTQTPQEDPIENLAAAYWEWRLAKFPETATFYGDRRYDARLTDISQDAEQARRDYLRKTMEVLAGIDVSTLPWQSQLTAQVMRTQLGNELRSEVCQASLWDVDQLYGYHLRLPELATWQPLDSQQAVADFVSRLAAIPILFDQQMDNLRLGLEQGYKAHKIAVERVLEQLAGMLTQPADQWPFLHAVERAQREAALDAEEAQSLRADILTLITAELVPAYAAYRDFLTQFYLPMAREGEGVRHNPQGEQCYQAMVQYYTGSELSAAEIHEKGQQELQRLHQEMNLIAQQAGHEDFRAYAAALKQDENQRFATREEIIAHNEALVAKATAALPRAFGRLPPIPVGVKAIEEFREAAAPAAYYYSAADDGSRPAYYYVNTHAPETRLRYNMEALAYHEANPGHHLQIAIAQSLEELPQLRRHGGFTAFVEGWALYAELVADELDLYSGPDTRFGMLNYQAWRAARLVVDTGLHALGWNREQAIDYMAANLALPRNEIVNEVDRYIVWPGQALAYMLGRMEIQRLRGLAESSQSEHFDVRQFHDRILENGALPLPVLEHAVERWLKVDTKGASPQ